MNGDGTNVYYFDISIANEIPQIRNTSREGYFIGIAAHIR